MRREKEEWILAAALLFAVNALMLPARLLESADWGEMMIRGVETAVFLSMLGAAVRGFRGLDWRIWLGTAALSAAGILLELLSWHFWNGFIPAVYLRSAAKSAIIITGEMMTCLLMMAAMSLILHRRYLRAGRGRLRTFGRLELWLCPVLVTAVLAAGVLAGWSQVVYFSHLQQQLMERAQTGDPMAALWGMVGMTTSNRMVWADDVNRACRLLLKALCVWIMACGVLGFAERAEQRQGELYDH